MRESPEVQRYVQFWFNNQPCPPPWVTYSTMELPDGPVEPKITQHDGAELWAQYKPRTVHVGQDPITIQNLAPAQMTSTDNKNCCCVLF